MLRLAHRIFIPLKATLLAPLKQKEHPTSYLRPGSHTEREIGHPTEYDGLKQEPLD